MSIGSRVRGLLATRRDLVILTLAALLVRLVWNLKVHPPLEYVASDMAGYLERARTSLDMPGERLPHHTLFPWGTHVMLAVVMKLFGRENGAAIGGVYALLGAGAVAYGFLLAEELTRSRTLARVVGAILVVYYPWISLGGYVLSEPPFTLFLCATAYHGLCLADHGRPRDAWLFGASMALAAVFRPQILVSVPLLGLHWLVHRKAWHWQARGLLVAAAAPVALVLAFSAVRTQLYTGAFGLISNNGPLNFAFGRCHAISITAVSADRKGVYSPPAFGALSRHDKAEPGGLFTLDPAIDEKISFDGHMWDGPPLRRLASECVEKTGLARQVKYAVTHVLLLWKYNVIWPDMSVSRALFHKSMEVSCLLHNFLIVPGALVGLALSLRRRGGRLALVSLHVFGLLAVAMIYFGDTRLRAPYDALLLILAAVVYRGAYRAVKRRRAA